MDKQIFKELGRYFKDKREQKKLTLAQVSEYVGCTAQYICNIENGRSLASWAKIFKLLKIYDINQNEFIEILAKVQKAYWKRQLNRYGDSA
jgi:transcriptional regulator with XRE-family HTH domain